MKKILLLLSLITISIEAWAACPPATVTTSTTSICRGQTLTVNFAGFASTSQTFAIKFGALGTYQSASITSIVSTVCPGVSTSSTLSGTLTITVPSSLTVGSYAIYVQGLDSTSTMASIANTTTQVAVAAPALPNVTAITTQCIGQSVNLDLNNWPTNTSYFTVNFAGATALITVNVTGGTSSGATPCSNTAIDFLIPVTIPTGTTTGTVTIIGYSNTGTSLGTVTSPFTLSPTTTPSPTATVNPASVCRGGALSISLNNIPTSASYCDITFNGATVFSQPITSFTSNTAVCTTSTISTTLNVTVPSNATIGTNTIAISVRNASGNSVANLTSTNVTITALTTPTLSIAHSSLAPCVNTVDTFTLTNLPAATAYCTVAFNGSTAINVPITGATAAPVVACTTSTFNPTAIYVTVPSDAITGTVTITAYSSAGVSLGSRTTTETITPLTAPSLVPSTTAVNICAGTNDTFNLVGLPVNAVTCRVTFQGGVVGPVPLSNVTMVAAAPCTTASMNARVGVTIPSTATSGNVTFQAVDIQGANIVGASGVLNVSLTPQPIPSASVTTTPLCPNSTTNINVYDLPSNTSICLVTFSSSPSNVTQLVNPTNVSTGTCRAKTGVLPITVPLINAANTTVTVQPYSSSGTPLGTAIAAGTINFTPNYNILNITGISNGQRFCKSTTTPITVAASNSNAILTVSNSAGPLAGTGTSSSYSLNPSTLAPDVYSFVATYNNPCTGQTFTTSLIAYIDAVPSITLSMPTSSYLSTQLTPINLLPFATVNPSTSILTATGVSGVSGNALTPSNVSPAASTVQITYTATNVNSPTCSSTATGNILLSSTLPTVSVTSTAICAGEACNFSVQNFSTGTLFTVVFPLIGGGTQTLTATMVPGTGFNGTFSVAVPYNVLVNASNRATMTVSATTPSYTNNLLTVNIIPAAASTTFKGGTSSNPSASVVTGLRICQATTAYYIKPNNWLKYTAVSNTAFGTGSVAGTPRIDTTQGRGLLLINPNHFTSPNANGYTIAYSYRDSCAHSTITGTFQFYIDQNVTLSLVGPTPAPFSSNLPESPSTPVSLLPLVNISPAGITPTITGNGVYGTTFIPSASNVGNNTVTFSVNNSGVCPAPASVSTIVTVGSVPRITGFDRASICTGEVLTINGLSFLSTGYNITVTFNGANPVVPFGVTTTSMQVTVPPTWSGSGSLVVLFVPTGTGPTITTAASPSPLSVTSGQTAQLTNVGTTYCYERVPPVVISGIPVGGTFTINTVAQPQANTINGYAIPVGASAGLYNVSYSVASNCASGGTLTKSDTFRIAPVLFDSFSITRRVYYRNSPSAALTNIDIIYNQSNSTTVSYSSPNSVGVSNNIFTPANLAIGQYALSCTVASASCSKTITRTAYLSVLDSFQILGLPNNNAWCYGSTVTVLPDPSFTSFITTSEIQIDNNAPVALGTGYSLSTLSAGNHTILLIYRNTNNGYYRSFQENVTVYPEAPPANVTANASYCLLNTAVNLSGTPLGGNYTFSRLNGASPPSLVLSNTTGAFTPNSAAFGTGSYSVQYALTTINGCTSTSATTFSIAPSITVNPNVGNFLNSTICSNSPRVALSGSPTPGVFSGNGVSLENGVYYFNPNQIQVRNTSQDSLVTLTYTYTSPQGCISSGTVSVRVLKAPRPVISALATSYCSTGNNIPFSVGRLDTFAVNPISQSSLVTFNGATLTGINNNYSINPVTAIIGNNVISYTLTYDYAGGNSCSSTITNNLAVGTGPAVSLSGLPSSVCNNSSTPITISGSASPIGGIFTLTRGGVVVPGFNGITYTPSTRPAGTDVLTYSITASNGCQSQASISIAVNNAPIPSINASVNTSICSNSAPLVLIGQASPLLATTSGVFSGQGIVTTGNSLANFNPTLAPIGGNLVTYTATDANGCTASTSINVTVHQAPSATFANLDSTYCPNAAAIPLVLNLQGTFTGSDFSIPNQVSGQPVSLNIPQLGLNAGPHTITYTVTDNNNCTTASTQSFAVSALAQPSIIGTVNGSPLVNGMTICESQDTIRLRGNPTGGTFSGSGILNTNANTYFDASLIDQSVTSTPITYSINDGNNCAVSRTINISIARLPNVFINGVQNAYCQSVPSVAISLPSNQFGTLTYSTDDITYSTIVAPYFSGINGQYYFHPNQFPTQGTDLWIRYTAVSGVCSNSVKQKVTINPLPTVDISGIDPTRKYCSNGEVTLTLQPSQNSSGVDSLILIHGNSSTLLPNNIINFSNTSLFDSAGTYTIKYKFVDPNSCSAFSERTFNLYAQPVVGYIREGLCEGDSLMFTDASTLSLPDNNSVINHYRWDYMGYLDTLGASTRHPNPIPGFFRFYHEVETSNGCKENEDITLYYGNSPEPSFTYSGSCLGSTTTFNAQILGVSANDTLRLLVWDYGDGSPLDTVTSLSTSHTYANSGLYDVQLYALYGQSSSDCGTTHTNKVVIAPVRTPTNAAPYYSTPTNRYADWLPITETGDSSLWSFSPTSYSNDSIWHTRITPTANTYPASTRAYLYGPCFDLNNLQRPMLSLDVWFDTQTSADGVLVEYSTDNTTWNRLGTLGDGIKWYNAYAASLFNTQSTDLPYCWAGRNGGFQTARLKLDGIRNGSSMRIRFVFASDGGNPGTVPLKGFGFRNFKIVPRGRMVLLENFANVMEPGMATANAALYSLVGTPSNNNGLDVQPLQYHIVTPGSDQLNLRNPDDPSARQVYYGITSANTQTIGSKRFLINNNSDNGQHLLDSLALSDSPFNINILNSALSSTGGSTQYNIQVNVEALAPLFQNTTVQDISLRIALVEDDFNNNLGGNKYVLAKFSPDAAGSLFRHAWQVGDTETVTYSGSVPFGVTTSRAYFVVFIQNDSTKEVYQTVTTRDLSAFYYTDLPTVTPPSQSLNNIVLYPNPTSGTLNIRFEQALDEEEQYTITSTTGAILKVGQLPQGERQFSLPSEDLPEGLYFLTLRKRHETLKFIVFKD